MYQHMVLVSQILPLCNLGELIVKDQMHGRQHRDNVMKCT